MAQLKPEDEDPTAVPRSLQQFVRQRLAKCLKFAIAVQNDAAAMHLQHSYPGAVLAETVVGCGVGVCLACLLGSAAWRGQTDSCCMQRTHMHTFATVSFHLATTHSCRQSTARAITAA